MPASPLIRGLQHELHIQNSSRIWRTNTMTFKKDMRRLDLAIPYVDPPKDKNDADMTGAMSSTMPMAAMFTRNRMIGWVAFVFSLQSWLGESAEQKKTATTPAYMSVLMSLMALAVTYLPVFLPPTGGGSVATPLPTPSP
ncbi:hypothetical protein BDW59DRAFT_140735 [Aspergillus cavernicola]|uniref:Protein Asterix n=1 Tax=Aspergillus cavernicola TaxID=176166 RepID=A0ABR4IWK9_9EURO